MSPSENLKEEECRLVEQESLPLMRGMKPKERSDWRDKIRYAYKKANSREIITKYLEDLGSIETLEQILNKKLYDKVATAKQQGFMFTGFGMYTDYLGITKQFWVKQPFHYDTHKIFWFWNNQDKKWEQVDDTDLLNAIDEQTQTPTTDTKIKSLILEGMKRVGRKNKPTDMKKTWVQFKDKIYDVKTGEEFEATPTYFVTNPIQWNVGESEETPTIDKLFSEWVGEEHKQELYEIIAYTLSTNKFMQRLFVFCGGGSNGKGTFIKLLYRFLGEDNCVSSELKALSEDKFEAAILYKKLLCVMGEVSFGDLKNTNMLKKLAGEDKISFQFKTKTPFTDNNTATCICLTNSLPITPDKSVGFYRKWKINDFPNQFKQLKEDLIGAIPNFEFENLAKKCLRILKELYENPTFTNEGNFEERTKRYEERSNPVMRFVEEECDEVVGNNISLRDFTNACNIYLKSNHLRVLTPKQVGIILRNEGFSVGSRKDNNGNSVVVILNLILKTIKTIKTSINPISFLICKTNTNLDSFDGNDGNLPKDNIIFEQLPTGVQSLCSKCGESKVVWWKLKGKLFCPSCKKKVEAGGSQ